MTIDVSPVQSQQDMPTRTSALRDDQSIDRALRPQSLSEYIGQSAIKRNLGIVIDAAIKRKEAIDHILFYGSAGLGKTTLSHIIAKEMGVGITVTSGPAIERVGDLGSILTNLSDGDVLFIDEIHRLRKTIEEVLYPAMEDGVIDIIVGKGPSARTLQLDLPKFTLVGATTQMGVLSNPLRNRFGSTYKLTFYTLDEMAQIVTRSAKLLEIDIDTHAVKEIARRSRQTPRVANRLVRRIRDYAQAHDFQKVTYNVVCDALKLLDIDESGLELMDRELLEKIITVFHGGPVGVKTLAAALSEEVFTIEEVYEPYLIQRGFIMRTSRGRVALEAAFKHLHYDIPVRYRAMRDKMGI